jgi:hypothetical protein
MQDNITFITVQDYAAQRGVSKQFVYEYIKKGKLELVEVPLFFEYEGKRHEAGSKKMLKIMQK